MRLSTPLFPEGPLVLPSSRQLERIPVLTVVWSRLLISFKARSAPSSYWEPKMKDWILPSLRMLTSMVITFHRCSMSRIRYLTVRNIFLSPVDLNCELNLARSLAIVISVGGQALSLSQLGADLTNPVGVLQGLLGTLKAVTTCTPSGLYVAETIPSPFSP
jgi:hypothetical protein